MKFPIYMDYQATTPVDPRVAEAMLPYFSDVFGNPASRHHQFGWKAEEAVENARGALARVIGAESREVFFTSGATESNNLAIKGVAESYRRKGDHLVTCVTEHHAVLDVCRRLEKQGFRVTELPVDQYGLVDPEDIRKAITEKTILVSLMTANNEVGTIHPIETVGRICRERGVLFHSDAAQAVGKIPVDVQAMSVDLLSFSSHKIYGPKGVGALYVRRKSPRVRLTAQMDGGGHENGLRSGTLNVPGIVGFAKALELCVEVMREESARLAHLRDLLKQSLMEKLEDVFLNGHPERRLPHNLHMSFSGIEAEALMMDMKEVAVSSGAACTTASPEPSHVLRALGLSEELLHSSIRFGLGRFTTSEEVHYVAGRVAECVERLRTLSVGSTPRKADRGAVPAQVGDRE